MSGTFLVTALVVVLLPVPAGSRASRLQMLVLSAVFMAMTFTTFAGYALVAGAVRERVLSSERVMRTVRRAFGVCFAGLALRLATEHR